jgi:hypothetical protein
MNLPIMSSPKLVAIRSLIVSFFAACALLFPDGQDTQARAAVDTQEQEIGAQEKRVKEVFETEKEDPEWSQRAVSLWTQVFEKEDIKEELKGIQLRNVECRTTLCRVELTPSDPAQGAVVFEQDVSTFMHFMPWQGSGFGKIENPDGQAPVAVLYMAREGHTLPFFPDRLGRGR